MKRQSSPQSAPILHNFQVFLQSDYANGTLLLLATLVAISMANSPLSDAYHSLLEYNLTTQLMFWIGVCFEMPMVVMFLANMWKFLQLAPSRIE